MKPLVYGLVQTSSVVLCSLLAATTALGQITPDNTLGNESSLVTPNVNVNGNLADLIEGGAIRESNLFHSFSDFNVAEFGRVYFANPAGIENILSRVTGTNVSNILGTLGVLGNANLFLINPNGIVFGPNSLLDLGGSFFGSTADSVLFEDGTVFSAKNPNGKPLLTINIPSGLQYGSNPGSITNQSFFGLQVPNGQTLGLIGGEVSIPGGRLTASDGRIELGSVGSNNVVKLTPTNTSFVLDYSGVQAFQDISLSDFAFVTTSGENGGSIQVRGANVTLSDRSFVFASTNGSGSGGGIVVKASQLSLEGGSRITADVTGSGQGGDLTVNASEFVRVNGIFSALGAVVLPGATGKAGNVRISTGQLMVSDGAQVAASTFGLGDGGDLTVNAEETVQLIGTSADGQIRSGLFSQTEGTGKAGNVRISTGQLIVSDGAVVSAGTFGLGDGGNLTVDADEKVQLIGTSADGRIVSGLFSQTEGTGNGGELKITTGQLIVSDGARVSADTLGEGDGGNLTVDADEKVQLIGTSADGQSASGLFAQANLGSKGKAGDVSITTGQLIVSDRAQVSTSTVGQGNGGELSITTGQLIVSDAALVSAATLGEGDGGNLTVDASSTVQVIGTDASGLFVSGLTTQTQGTGNAGELNITTGQLIISDGAVVSAGTLGEGNGGTLSVDADSTVQVIGTTADGLFPSRLFTETQGTGNAGELNITTGQLIVSDGAVVSASTLGEGDGGNLTVDAEEKVQLIGTSADGQSASGLFAQANLGSKGKAGDVSITTGQLIVSDRAQVSTSTVGQGNGGELSITTGQLIVSDAALVSAATLGEGDGGNLTVDASSTVQVIGTDASGLFVSGLTTQTQGTGNAGELNITTGQLIISDGAVVSAGTLGEGNGGTLSVDADSTVQVIGTTADGLFPSRLFTETQGTGNAGELNITTGQLIVSDGAVVSAGTIGEGDGGDLIVDADSTVQVIGTSADGQFLSRLTTETQGKGKAGELNISTGELIVSDGAVVSAGTFGLGDGGNLTVNASDSVQVIGTSADGRAPSGLFTQSQGRGDAGEFLKITTEELMVSDGAVVSATSTQQGSSAGTLEIKANSIFVNKNAIISAETAGGDDSNITLYSRDIRLFDESNIITDARNTTTGGNITIDTDILLGLGNSDITANAQQGRGGRVTINAQGIFGLEFRDRLTPGNDITSTSELGPSFSGEVTLNTSVDPTSGLIELPGSLVDAEAILANDLCGFENNRIAGGSSFTITGKGGLPPTRLDPVINTDRTVGWRTRPGIASTRRQQLQQQANVRRPQPVPEKKVIIEAQGWVTAKDGTIILTAHPFRGTLVEQILPNLDCHSGRGSRE